MAAPPVDERTRIRRYLTSVLPKTLCGGLLVGAALVWVVGIDSWARTWTLDRQVTTALRAGLITGLCGGLAGFFSTLTTARTARKHPEIAQAQFLADAVKRGYLPDEVDSDFAIPALRRMQRSVRWAFIILGAVAGFLFLPHVPSALHPANWTPPFLTPVVALIVLVVGAVMVVTFIKRQRTESRFIRELEARRNAVGAA